MTDQAPELLPCPLCNSKVALSVLEDEPGEIISAWVRCDCGLEIHERRTEAEAIERWNTRPPSERPVAQVREALEAAKRMQCLNATLQLKTQCWSEIDTKEQQHWIALATVALTLPHEEPDIKKD